MTVSEITELGPIVVPDPITTDFTSEHDLLKGHQQKKYYYLSRDILAPL